MSQGVSLQRHKFVCCVTVGVARPLLPECPMRDFDSWTPPTATSMVVAGGHGNIQRVLPGESCEIGSVGSERSRSLAGNFVMDRTLLLPELGIH